MKRFQPYLPILWALVLNFINLLWRVARQIVLPGRRKTGNLLTSLFLLFSEFAEQLIGCRRALIGVPIDLTINIPAWKHGKIWLRRGMLVAAWALFILASFEYEGYGGGVKTQESIIEHPSQTLSIVVAAEVVAPSPDSRPGGCPVVPVRFEACRQFVQPRTKRWLLLRTLRI